MKPFQVEDIFRHVTLTGLDGSPHHHQLVFKRGRALRESDNYEGTLWHLRTGDERPRQLTSASSSARAGKWNHDGSRLAFLSTRGEAGTQVHVLPMSGGEALPLTHAKATLTGIEGWSPDDGRLLVLASAEWQEDGEATDTPKGTRPPQVARYLPYKIDGTGIVAGTRTHLFSVDLAEGRLHAITRGDFDVAMGRWSPDGTRLAYLRNRTGRMRHRDDVWVAGADGGNARLLIDRLPKPSALEWSPDGRWLALASSEEEGDSQYGLWLADAGDGSLRRLGGGDLELEPAAGFHWHPDGSRLATIVSHRGLSELAVVTVPGGEVTRFPIGLRQVIAIAPWGDRIAFVCGSMRQFEEVYSIDWNGRDLQRHTRFNRTWLRRRERPRVSRRRFAVPDGNGGEEKIDAWILRPAQGDGPFPVYVDMHGGPHSTVLVDFAAHTHWYALCARGWAIVAPNAVGSGSFGKEFARRLRGRWGELDLPQYEAIVRRLQDEGFADERVVCGGKSYGGFLSAWAVGHSDLFRAAIVAAPVANIESHCGTSDTGFYVTPFAMHGDCSRASLEDLRERCHRLSPIAACHDVRAAVLILQGENDGRCPIGQSEELFANLIRCSQAPVEMVVYPGSTHAEAESGRPGNRVDYHARIVGWATRWVERNISRGTPGSQRHESKRHESKRHESRRPETTTGSGAATRQVASVEGADAEPGSADGTP